MFGPRILITLVAAGLLAGRAHAETIVIDETDGAQYDSILDGAYIPPPPAPGSTDPKDNVPDALGTAGTIAIAYHATGIQQVGVAELPLAELGALDSDDIDTAILTLRLNDVISTFWPSVDGGATFDGTAADSIAVFAYDADGTIALADFNNVIGAPDGVVVTSGSPGSITDANLALNGALSFEVDLTDPLKDLIDGGATHIGILFATTDSATGTSLDTTPALAGAALPFLTVTTVVHEPPVFDDAEQLCQRTLALEGRKYPSFAHTQMQICFNRVLKDVAAAKPLTNAMAACAKALDLGASPASKVDGARAKAVAKVQSKCPAPLVSAGLESPCDAGATTFADVAACVLDHNLEQVQEMVRAEYADACGIATGVALEGDYPVVCDAP